jgi:hypothetical protein
MRISESEFQAWWSSPVALEFRRMMKEDLDKLAYGTMVESVARDQIGNAIEVGRFKAILHYFSMNYQTLMGGNDEQNRDKTSRI